MGLGWGRSSLSDERLAGLPLLGESQLPYPKESRGKVRDIYRDKNELLLFATDRQSAFDRNVALVPAKGWALSRQSAWWFDRCADLVPHHMLESAGRVTRVRRCRVLPVEVVVRGFVSGSTSTSIWRQYCEGKRVFDGVSLPEGLRKNTRLAHPIITPTTKDADHDRPLDNEQAASLVGAELWRQVRERALALFERGSRVAAAAGLLLVDTKYEFGIDEQGTLTLVDELHTGDSSRFCLRGCEGREWGADAHGDKEFLRLWLIERCDPYHDPWPAIPAGVIREQAQRYLALYEKLTGERTDDHYGELCYSGEDIVRQIEMGGAAG